MNDATEWRIFLALPLEEGIKAELDRMVGELRRGPARLTWVKPDAMHLTLKFLGETSPEKVPPLSVRLRDACSQLAPFPIGIGGLGSYPSRGRPRVVWAGVEEPAGPLSGSLARLAGAVEDAAAAAGFPRERRPFSPHLTLGRVRGGMFLAEMARALEAGAGRRFGSQECHRLALYRSHLSPAGPRHEELASFPLVGGKRPS